MLHGNHSRLPCVTQTHTLFIFLIVGVLARLAVLRMVSEPGEAAAPEEAAPWVLD